MIFRFERRGRRPAAFMTVGLILVAVLLLWQILDMAVWIALVLVAFTLPTLWDIWRDTRSFVEIWPGRIVWASSLGRGDRSDVDHVRLNRRFDGSFKVTLVHVGGATTRLPADIAPPAGPLETALQTAGISAQRHPFSPI